MDMANASTSLDQLDAMLASGSLSQTDYETLKSAMASKSTKRPEFETSSRPTLRKSWSNRRLGGVCAGLGEWMGVEPRLVRLGFLVALLFTGGSALMVYCILCFLLPWKQSECDQVTRFSWRFAASIYGLWLALQGMVFFWARPLARLFAGSGAELPYLSQIAIRLAHVNWFGAVLQVCLLMVAACIYSAIPNSSPLRRFVAATVCGGLVLVMIILVLGSFAAIFALGDKVR